jgi:hypothetical protein
MLAIINLRIYGPTIKHLDGHKNIVTDALSHLDFEEEDANKELKN